MEVKNLSRRDFLKLFPPLGLYLDRDQDGRIDLSQLSPPTKLGIKVSLGFLGIRGTLAAHSELEEKTGISVLKQAVGSVSRINRNRTIEANNIDTTDFPVYRPSFDVPNLVIGMGVAHCGKQKDVCDYGLMYQSREEANKSRARFLSELSKTTGEELPDPNGLVYIVSDESEDAKQVDSGDLKRDTKNIIYGEAVIFQAVGEYLAFQPVDCPGIILIDEQTKTIALIHANKLIENSRIIENTLLKLKQLGIDINRLRVWVSPSVHNLEGDTSTAIRNMISRSFFPDKISAKRPTKSLTQILVSQLTNGGVDRKKIDVSPIDTTHAADTFSLYGANRGVAAGGKRVGVLEYPGNYLARGLGNHFLVVGFAR